MLLLIELLLLLWLLSRLEGRGSRLLELLLWQELLLRLGLELGLARGLALRLGSALRLLRTTTK